MLRIRQLKHLVNRLDTPLGDMERIAADVRKYCKELILFDPAKPGKQREVLDVTGKFRTIQERIYRRILVPQLVPSEYSYGGVPGRHIKANAQAHMESTFALTADISNFYPSISHVRVYKLFRGPFQCSPDVSHFLTRFCTYRHHLALGLVTSPILADRIFQPIDERIADMCAKAGLIYTRFVDDICLSGKFDLSPENAGVARLLESIVGQYGFEMQEAKRRSGALSDPKMTITKLRIKNGHVDVRWEYIRELERRLEDAKQLAADADFRGPYFTSAQLRGQVDFVSWINPSRRRTLTSTFASIDWARVHGNAAKRELVMHKKTLVRARGPGSTGAV